MTGVMTGVTADVMTGVMTGVTADVMTGRTVVAVGARPRSATGRERRVPPTAGRNGSPCRS
jgi:hypothetical protein